MQPPSFKTYPLLKPLSWLYQQIMSIRNQRFDSGKLHTQSFNLPVVSVGNISVGGTGKTPMCRYILQLFNDAGMSPALLSRGYGRKTKGFRQVTAHSTATLVGDEPLEMYSHFEGTIPVYVCEDRCSGARQILSTNHNVKTLVLDDAYQHRYIYRDLNIMLTDYNRLYTRDKVMPEGRLREAPSGADRADIIVVTKCPQDFSATDAQHILKEIKPTVRQQVFFTTIKYSPLHAPYRDMALTAQRTKYANPTKDNLKALHVLIFTGIAKATPLIEYYKSLTPSVETMHFADHHAFTLNDIQRIVTKSDLADIVITTSKDFQRLPDDIPHCLKEKLFVQHIDIQFLFDRQQAFNQLVLQATNHPKHHN